MAGPNLEVFKFGLYMFFPIWIMVKFGDPDWYTANVQPYKELLWPAYDATFRPPRSQPELQAELARLKAERAAKRQRIAHDRAESTTASGRTEEVASPQAAVPSPSVGQVQAELAGSNANWGPKTEERIV